MPGHSRLERVFVVGSLAVHPGKQPRRCHHDVCHSSALAHFKVASARAGAYPGDFKLFENFYRCRRHDDLKPCVHMPVALFFVEYRRRLEGMLEGACHWEADKNTVFKLHARLQVGAHAT
jgi:hypothetical protein